MPEALSEEGVVSQVVTLVNSGVILIDDALILGKSIERDADGYRLFPDRRLPKMHYLSSRKAATGLPWHLGEIDAPADLDGSGVHLGVIDTGFEPSFPDLGATTPSFATLNASGKSFVTSKTINDLDPDCHGSSVSIFTVGTNAGLAKGVHLHVAAVPPDAARDSEANVQLAIDYLLGLRHTSGERSMGCDIINLSRATTEEGVYDEGHIYKTIKDGRDAWKTLFVVSVGNDDSKSGLLQCPGAFDCVLSVGAVSEAGYVGTAWGTNLAGHSRPDLVAPGIALEHSTGWVRSGSSFAAPLVSAAAALILQRKPELRSDPDALQREVVSHVKAIVGSGRHPNATAAELAAMAGAGQLALTTL